MTHTITQRLTIHPPVTSQHLIRAIRNGPKPTGFTRHGRIHNKISIQCLVPNLYSVASHPSSTSHPMLLKYMRIGIVRSRHQIACKSVYKSGHQEGQVHSHHVLARVALGAGIKLDFHRCNGECRFMFIMCWKRVSDTLMSSVSVQCLALQMCYSL